MRSRILGRPPRHRTRGSARPGGYDRFVNASDVPRPDPVDGELYGPAEVGPMLGVRPQVIVNWIREDRFLPSAVDSIGRNRFTADDVRRMRAGLGTGRARKETT
ncbi:MAG: hypothetical protein NVSMB29_14800 [Candidatus Dormibacteria bacterium]